MGIKHLNQFFIENCSPDAMCKMHLRNFAGRVLVVDTSIYLYKFIEKDALLENLYLMISVFRKYHITPVFVFDGKPPPEKKELLIKRKKEKDAAEEKYNDLRESIAGSASDTVRISQEMDKLKKRFIRVKDGDIVCAKQLMQAYGVAYLESSGESDQLCAYLVRHQFAYACVSDDMDMFLYGCDRVLRHLSLIYHEAIVYTTGQILSELDMSMDSFQDILIMSGTDYNVRDHASLSGAMHMYALYRDQMSDEFLKSDAKKFCEWTAPPGLRFFEWQTLCSANATANATSHTPNVEYFKQVFGQVPAGRKIGESIMDVDKMRRMREMFDLDAYIRAHREELKSVMDHLPFRQGDVDLPRLQQIMRTDGFMFLN